LPSRVARGPDGREWLVRSYRYRLPPWRTVSFSEPGPGDYGCVAAPLFFVETVIAAVGAFFGVLVLPLLAFVFEAPATWIWSRFNGRCYVEATYAGSYVSRMRWRTTTERVEAVVDQVVRQLELGYDRVLPHGAEFLGFERSRPEG
jgi:hypothetical protein